MGGYMRGLGAAFLFAASLVTSGAVMAGEGELILGQTMPYSGPASALSSVGKVQARYFQMINERGGINGRKIKLISLDDGYSPPKAVEQTRRLVESDEAVAIFGSMGTAQNAAVQRYLNSRKVPQLFVFAASDRFADPKTSPYTISGMTLFSTEAAIYARLVSESIPQARVAVLYQNDDYGREYLRSFKAELARLDPQAGVVAVSPYEVTSPTVESQVVTLASSDANVFLNASTGKFTSQAIRKAGELGWHAQQFLPIGSNFVSTILKPAGLANAKGAISATPTKTVGDPEWINDPSYLEWLAFMKKYYPEGDIEDQLNFTGWNVAVLMTLVIEACDNDLSPQNLMKQATTLKNVTLPGLIPGITVSSSPDDYRLIKALRPQRFDGERWVPISGTMAAR
ncbi:ABC transporter substrate-binding protein [Bradyrhizobium sp. 182]|nr:ABC transporter substrate-binding protein [Bradyrhizobium sp. CW12]MCK1530799.1 ABC transporter substrate-binding protein [Bradyrhizobium sp. 182]MCK1646396.1 ABC transporter substrate-binding protein [Bradyrhizobium sp. 154]MCK1665729.1 ABC transporter substrate-binding protein [Bradyrhizobium sp. 153]